MLSGSQSSRGPYSSPRLPTAICEYRYQTASSRNRGKRSTRARPLPNRSESFRPTPSRPLAKFGPTRFCPAPRLAWFDCGAFVVCPHGVCRFRGGSSLTSSCLHAELSASAFGGSAAASSHPTSLLVQRIALAVLTSCVWAHYSLRNRAIRILSYTLVTSPEPSPRAES